MGETVTVNWRASAAGIHLLDEFLSRRECSELLTELEHAYWRASRTYERQSDETFRSVLATNRISETAHQQVFPAGVVELLSRVEQKLVKLFDVDADRLEWWQATRYPIGGRFDYHLDSGYWGDEDAGERVRTFLLYLTTPAAGGGTHFRALDLLVEARAGRLVVWDDLFPDRRPNHSMIHAGMPVLAGEKVTLVTWEREKGFRPRQ
jgi:prolyl 4-hydroxylase